ncbi:hypothetical protein FLSI110296_06560 [Flavobacterium sinopsychrotolerans]|uniref:Uncharacterized protein n=1 Tax=Flavobacterium sinopsychrotolerans TaxID=604089 RepID=A0A1H8RFF6_9FLAO|nr:hypothetical protein [Flavobacterium sinopsychrotolerans]SEO64878.1 hypothetical protein SAMN04487942_0030 [Flavobacterium sinopsychrotolerans]
MSNKSNFIKKIIELLSEKNASQKEIIAEEIINIFAKAKNKECYTEALKTESIEKLSYFIKDFLLHDNALTRESLATSTQSECTFIED